MKFLFISLLYFTFLISCVNDFNGYKCIDSVCVEDVDGSYDTVSDCIESCLDNSQNSNVLNSISLDFCKNKFISRNIFLNIFDSFWRLSSLF